VSGLRFVFACGGTSGHIHPALAIAERLRLDHPDADILFCGTARGQESEVVPRAGFSFTPIRARGFPRRLSLDMFKALADFIAGRRQCRRLLKSFQPQAVIGTGGYVAGPMTAAAVSLKIPVLLHEQNAFPGRSNRLMARRSQAVCISYPGTEQYFPAGTRIELTGNPVREVFFKTGRSEARKRLGISLQQPLVLAMGGSLGARTINEAVLGLDNLTDFISASSGLDDHSAGEAGGMEKPWLILSAGKQHYTAVRAAAAGKAWLDVREYLQDVHLYMAAADLIICRSGAMTCAELTALGKPSILVPYPFAAGDHQRFNAKTLADAKAAWLVPDGKLNPAVLKEMIKRLFSARDELENMGRAAISLARPDAAAAICSKLYEVMR
jgi:UDP-N-acetylglucosamine--N-acetylmuramyl-(pentapeptide) pyrophosphoryl-undecaprenol N-acetylglucosamine transferase